MLAVPPKVISEKDLEEGSISGEDLLVGPSKRVTVPGVEEDEFGATTNQVPM